jgi:hypothetical protein
MFVIDVSDTHKHEHIHASICEEYYNGTPEITYYGVFGKDGIAAFTKCYNRTTSGEEYLAGRTLDTMNEIYSYNLQSISNYLNLITFLITLLMCVIIYVSTD